MRTGRALAAILGFASVFGAARPAARADSEETERRLKSAGVDDALRARIHEAIDRGVAFLLKQQEPAGSFVDHWTSAPRNREPNTDRGGISLLCALALRHAGTAPTLDPVRRAVDWVLARSPTAVGSPDRSVYSAGIAAMLLAAVPGHEVRVHRIVDALALRLDAATAYWGDDLPEAGAGGASPLLIPNLSSSQFAALGLRAGSRMGFVVPPDIWKRHALALCDEQTSTGSWRHSRAATQRRFGFPVDPRVDTGYPAGTFIGLANLLLARQALVEAKDGSAIGRIDEAIAKARRRLGRDAPACLEDPTDSTETVTTPVGELKFKRTTPLGSRVTAAGDGVYSTLYALEEACLCADVETFEVATPSASGGKKPGKVRLAWYATGAKWLLKVEEKDGGWSPTAGDPPTSSSEIETALALLFLLRSPQAFHPVKPSDVDAKPPDAVGPPDAPPPAMGR